MYVKNKKDILISSIIFIISVIVSLYVAYNTGHPGYKNLFLLPLIYGFVYMFFMPRIRKQLNNIYIHIFIVVSFARYVMLPLLITLTKHYGGRSSIPPMDSSFHLAIYLMIYEMIVVFLFSYFLFRNYKAPIKDGTIKYPRSIFVYIIFISFSIFLSIMFPESLRSFSFLKVANNFTALGEGTFIITTITYLLVVTKFLVFLLIMNFFRKKYEKNNNNIYVILSLLIVLLNITIFFGDNRADYVITSIASILLFFKLYPNFIKRAILPLIIIAIVVTSFINEDRNNATLTGGEDRLSDITETLQIYLAGPYNVAISIEAAKDNQNERKILNLGYELLRPVIGLNVLLKPYDIKSTSNYFNERMFHSNHMSQIVPMIGQGYFYLGFFLSPLIFLSYILLVKILIKTRDKYNRIEMFFFMSIPIARIGLAMGQNGAILANDISFFLVLFLIVYFINNKVLLKKLN